MRPPRKPPARDPSPLAQDDKSGVRCLFHSNDRGGGLVGWGGAARQVCKCPAAVCPPPPGFRNLCTTSKPTAPPSLSLRTSAHAGVAIRSPASRRLARPGRGAMEARTYDRPGGRCNAAHCGGYGLPRRCAPRNDSFGSRFLGAKLPIRLATARRGHDPAGHLPEPWHFRPNPLHPQVCHCEPARTLVWQSVPPQAVRLARPGRGRNTGPGL